MLFEDRISLILKLIEQNGSIENSKIIKDLKISEATLRRDLAYLEKEGVCGLNQNNLITDIWFV